MERFITNYRAMRRRWTLRKARSFREYLQWKVNFLTIDVCGRFGIAGCLMVDYQAFAKKCARDVFNMVVESTVDPSKVSIDDIFEYYERTWAKPRGLDLEVVKALEEELLNLFNSIDRVRAEYETMTLP